MNIAKLEINQLNQIITRSYSLQEIKFNNPSMPTDVEFKNSVPNNQEVVGIISLSSKKGIAASLFSLDELQLFIEESKKFLEENETIQKYKWFTKPVKEEKI